MFCIAKMILLLITAGIEVKGMESGEESDYFQSDMEGQEEMTKKSERDSITSVKDSCSNSSNIRDALDIEGMEDEDEDEEEIPPLFIHLTCSLRTSQGTLQSVPVAELPTCFSKPTYYTVRQTDKALVLSKENGQTIEFRRLACKWNM